MGNVLVVSQLIFKRITRKALYIPLLVILIMAVMSDYPLPKGILFLKNVALGILSNYLQVSHFN